jgi:hypothetical protein
MSTWKWLTSLNRLRVALVTLSLWFGGVALAESNAGNPAPATAPITNPIQAVIQAQIEALQADDFETAFAFAAPSIQRMFGNPTRFAQMIVNRYPMVWRPVDIQYLSVTRSGPYAWQRVMVTDQKNTLHILVYQLVPINQRWRISGVRLLALPGESI